jgi:hypothetical protein
MRVRRFGAWFHLVLLLSVNENVAKKNPSVIAIRQRLKDILSQKGSFTKKIYPQGNSNPRRLREREVS